jgi:hypothetical protein
MKELIIEFGNDTLGETRMYPRNPKGYEQAIKDMKLYKAQQKAEIDYLKAEIIAECKEHKEAMLFADKTIKTLEKALEMACEYLNDYQYFDSDCPRYNDCYEIENSKFWDCEDCDCSKLALNYFKTKAEETMKSESNND